MSTCSLPGHSTPWISMHPKRIRRPALCRREVHSPSRCLRATCPITPEYCCRLPDWYNSTVSNNCCWCLPPSRPAHSPNSQPIAVPRSELSLPDQLKLKMELKTHSNNMTKESIRVRSIQLLTCQFLIAVQKVHQTWMTICQVAETLHKISRMLHHQLTCPQYVPVHSRISRWTEKLWPPAYPFLQGWSRFGWSRGLSANKENPCTNCFSWCKEVLPEQDKAQSKLNLATVLL